MAGSLTNAGAKKLLDHFTGTTDSTFQSQYYVGAFTTTPGEGTAGTEAAGGSYARQAINFDAASAADPSATANSNTVEFPTGWSGTVNGIGIFDALAGTLIWWTDLGTPKTIGVTDVFRLAIGAVDLTID